MSAPSAGGRCPCGTGLPYDRCCGPIHRDERAAPTAEALMRSRYSAYAVGDAAYLLRSWARDQRPPTLDLDADVTWTGLDVEATSGGALLDTEGTVTFTAHHRRAGRDHELHERSRFTREDGRWVYVGPT